MNYNDINNMKYPNYNNSTLSMINTILSYYNVETNVKTNDKLMSKLNENKANVCLIILDGLGNNSLEIASKKGFLNQNKVDVISSVYPPTTVAAINTIASGLSPIEHGWLGWSLYFKEVDKSIDVFRNQYSGSNGEIPVGLNYKELIKYENIFTKIKKANMNSDLKLNYYYPDSIDDNMLDANIFKYKSFKDGLNQLVSNINNNNNRSFNYLYCDYPDKLMHIRGANSFLVNRLIKKMEKQIKNAHNKVKDNTVFIISADHGLTNIKGYFDIRNDKELGRMIKRRPSIETRSAAVWVKDKYKGIFKETFEAKYKDYFLVLTKEEVLNSKLFGEGTPHKRVDSFLGDYLIIAKDSYCIGQNKKSNKKKANKLSIINKLKHLFKPKVKFKATHAGITKEEFEIPLIII